MVFLLVGFCGSPFALFFLYGSFLYTHCVLLGTLVLFCSIYCLLSIKKKKKNSFWKCSYRPMTLLMWLSFALLHVQLASPKTSILFSKRSYLNYDYSNWVGYNNFVLLFCSFFIFITSNYFSIGSLPFA